jgi:hypothetical protein
MLTKFRCDALMNNKKSTFVVLMLVIFIGLGALISNSIVIENDSRSADKTNLTSENQSENTEGREVVIGPSGGAGGPINQSVSPNISEDRSN